MKDQIKTIRRNSDSKLGDCCGYNKLNVHLRFLNEIRDTGKRLNAVFQALLIPIITVELFFIQTTTTVHY